ncbi:glycosyltransferase [Phenylobacterium immobile]|uniref:glycosyltransferase n=1 Tax=Phenylobacterium immobile TaxID=21 RepID=UPI000B0475F5|nr:glycosyltransferase [Phenylobacterium immobile]
MLKRNRPFDLITRPATADETDTPLSTPNDAPANTPAAELIMRQAGLADVLSAVDRVSIELNQQNRMMSRLADILEQFLEVSKTNAARPQVVYASPEALAAPSAALAAPVAAPAKAKALKKLINWVIGPADNIQWAYGNNAKRLSSRLAGYDHKIADTGASDVAVYFDAKVADRYKVDAKKSVLRIGGPRPLDTMFGDDIEKMREAFAKFDAIIALNGELYLRAARAHPNVHLIPNAVDLEAWKPSSEPKDGIFTVGFAASMKSSAEAEVKGFAIAEAAAARVGARLLMTSKGAGKQIPHDRMQQDFYHKIDALIHPVGPGREGTSNVLMEALASGVPVITTVHSGYHGELLTDGRNVLIRERDELEFAEAIAMLQRDERMRRRIGNMGRQFAEQHHSLDVVAAAYGKVIDDVVKAKPKPAPKKKKVSFVPFWEPAEKFGSSRLRAHYPAQFLKDNKEFDVVSGYAEDADIVVVVQMCPDDLLEKLNANPKQFLIYDVCDKYYENPRVFKHLEPNIHSQQRFEQLCERADLIIVPSREMKAEIASRVQNKPVKYVPEPADYGATTPLPLRPAEPKVVLWYGNPDRGNWENAQPIIERLRDQHGYTPLIVSRRSFFKKFPDFHPFCQDWSMEAMKAGFEAASLCVVAYDQEEQAKSPNRYVAAMMHGLPTLVVGSPATREIIDATGQQFALVSDDASVDQAMAVLQAPGGREQYVEAVQAYLASQFGEEAIADVYATTFKDQTFSKAAFAGGKRRIAFVSHNMTLGEGAPWSLFELLSGLREHDIEPFVYSACGGPLLEQYQAAGIAVEVFDTNANHVVKVLNTKYVAIEKSFTDFLKTNKIEAVVANTVKSAPLVKFATNLGIPAACIARESYVYEERFSYFRGDARLAAVTGLTEAPEIVFVAHASRKTWDDQPFKGKVSVIPNGISPQRFVESSTLTKAEARERFGIPADDVVAICVGTINLRKGQGEILEAFASLPPAVRNKARIIFLGAVQNSHLAGFMEGYDALPAAIRDRVMVVNATDEVAPYYIASDLFLMNSNSEAYPRSVVEGLYFGLPVLSTPVAGVVEQVRPGESGFLYDYNDMNSWKSYFTDLVKKPDLLKEMSANAHKAFWKLTGYNEMLLSYKSIISRMIA